MSSAYSRIRLSSAWSLHLSFLYYTVNSFRCNLYFRTSFSSTLHSSLPFHSFRMSLPSIWHQLPAFFWCRLYGFVIHLFQSLFVATSPPDFKTLSTIFIKTFHYTALPTSCCYLIFNLYPCCDLSTQCLFFLLYYIRLLPLFYFHLSGFSKNPTLSTSITNILRSALTWFGLIFHQVIEGCFLSLNRHRRLILLSLFP